MRRAPWKEPTSLIIKFKHDILNKHPTFILFTVSTHWLFISFIKHFPCSINKSGNTVCQYGKRFIFFLAQRTYSLNHN